MSNELQQTLNNILNDKNTNLLPENLRAGVTCLGVEGTAEVPTPIYEISDWVSINIPELSSMSGSIRKAIVCYPYLLIDYHVSSGVRTSYIYIIKINNGVSEVLYIESGRSSNYTSSSLFGYDDNYLYFYLGTSLSCAIRKLDLNTKEVSDTSGIIQINDEYNYPYIIENGLILRPYVYRSGSSYPTKVYKISNNGDTVETLYTFPNGILENVRMLTNNIFWDFSSKKIYKITEEGGTVSVSSSPSSLSISTLYGINSYGTKIFADDGIYSLSSTFSLGEKIADFTLKETLYCQRWKLLYREYF